jgi:hypothetical protein
VVAVSVGVMKTARTAGPPSHSRTAGRRLQPPPSTRRPDLTHRGFSDRTASRCLHSYAMNDHPYACAAGRVRGGFGEAARGAWAHGQQRSHWSRYRTAGAYLLEKGSIMKVPRAEVLRVLRRAGLFEIADKLALELPDIVDRERDRPFFDRYDISLDMLVSRMGGSP